MSLGPSCLLGIGRQEVGALLHPITRPTTSNEGAHSPWVLLVDPLALDGGALEAAPLPLALRLAFDGGGDGHRLAALDLHSGVVSLWSGEFTNDTAVWQGLSQGAVWSTRKPTQT